MNSTTSDLRGRVVVITGGTSGIGHATALSLAQRGAEVLVIGRDDTKGRDTEAALKAVSGGLGAFLKADLSLVGDTRRVVTELTTRLSKLDALIQSAGMVDFEATTTSEGLNRMFVTNFLHKLLLSEGLAPILAEAQGRMVLVAADIPNRLGPDWSNFEGMRRYAGVLALPRLHGASLALAQHFAHAWKASGVDVTALHPGQVDTGFFRSFTGVWKCGQALLRLIQVPVERPAALVSWLAFSPEASGQTGHLFPSVRRYSKRRELARSAATVERVLTTARSVIASV